MFFVFFFQAEDGIRDADVTGVQTCALPILIPWDRTAACSRQVESVPPSRHLPSYCLLGPKLRSVSTIHSQSTLMNRRVMDGSSVRLVLRPEQTQPSRFTI